MAADAAVAVDPLGPARQWFASRGWSPFPFQEAVWMAILNGQSGLLHAPTGTGKTHAIWMGLLLDLLQSGAGRAATASGTPEGASNGAHAPARMPLSFLWITPLRALANDTVQALNLPLMEMGLPWRVELRTGDTASSVKQRQRRTPPLGFVTTPESLSVLLSYAEAADVLRQVRLLVVDEWHELMSTKRGVQTELGLAAVRALAPQARTWGLSASIGNLDQAMRTLLGPHHPPDRTVLVRAALEKSIGVDTIIPPAIERFPWAGHLGTRLVGPVAEAILNRRSTLLFTNTRSQAELWFQSLLRHEPSLVGQIALHHGSLDREIRNEVERLLAAGRLKGVVCTSSLDLGVDFAPVDQVIQIGSPKGIARLMQRAGRSGHQPNAVSRVVGVPTNALELVEFAAARDALQARRIEPRWPLDRPLDVLVQHLVTRALGGGFHPESMRSEVMSTHAYADLDDRQWQWALDFVTRGGDALSNYPDYHRVEIDPESGLHLVKNRRIARLHRMAIGTITSDSMMLVRYLNGRTIGSIEESFIGRLRPGDCFVFAGRLLELIRIHEMTAQVRPARSGRGHVPRWAGGRSPLSTELAETVRSKLGEAARQEYGGAEMQAVRPLFELQRAMSIVPRPDQLLIERTRWRDGHHAFVIALEGRLVHDGIASLVAYRLTQGRSTSITISATDWGFELLSRHPLPDDEETWRRLISPEGVLDDLVECLNTTELPRRYFRDIARIAGLVLSGFPGQQKSLRQLQASSNLVYEVLRDYDPGNLLLSQADREALEHELEIVRLRTALERMSSRELVVQPTARFSPLAFPIWADMMRAQYISSEQWSERVREMLELLEADLAGVDRGGGDVSNVNDIAIAAAATPRKRRGVQRMSVAAIAPGAERPKKGRRGGRGRRPAAEQVDEKTPLHADGSSEAN